LHYYGYFFSFFSLCFQLNTCWEITITSAFSRDGELEWSRELLVLEQDQRERFVVPGAQTKFFQQRFHSTVFGIPFH
jgi:hypothetical protein